jgi:hypothetical protein
MSGLAWNAEQREVRELCRIACESAAVTVSSYPTGNGLRLRLVSERSDAQVLLDATVLEALCHLTPQAAADLVRARAEGDTGSPDR